MQALLNRMDQLEYRLLHETREQVEGLRDTVGSIQKARRAQASEVETSRAPLVASHRGPGSEGLLPTPAAPAASAQAPAPAPSLEKTRESPFQKFNKMVKSRGSTPGEASKHEEFLIGTPLDELDRVQALAAVARADEEMLLALGPPGINVGTAVTADLAHGVPIWTEDDCQSPVHAGQRAESSPLGSLTAMRGQPGSRRVFPD